MSVVASYRKKHEKRVELFFAPVFNRKEPSLSPDIGFSHWFSSRIETSQLARVYYDETPFADVDCVCKPLEG